MAGEKAPDSSDNDLLPEHLLPLHYLEHEGQWPISSFFQTQLSTKEASLGKKLILLYLLLHIFS